jgi:hypothetical protein
MAYIGRSPTFGAFQTQTLIPNGSAVVFTLQYPAPSPSSILVSVNGVLQQPVSAYTLQGGGSQIVFTEAIETGAQVFIIFLGEKYTVVTLGNSSVTEAMIVDRAVTSTKLSVTGVMAGTYGLAANSKITFSVDSAGRVLNAATVGIDNVPQANVTNLTTTLATKASTGKAIAMSLVFGG